MPVQVSCSGLMNIELVKAKRKCKYIWCCFGLKLLLTLQISFLLSERLKEVLFWSVPSLSKSFWHQLLFTLEKYQKIVASVQWIFFRSVSCDAGMEIYLLISSLSSYHSVAKIHRSLYIKFFQLKWHLAVNQSMKGKLICYSLSPSHRLIFFLP